MNQFTPVPKVRIVAVPLPRPGSLYGQTLALLDFNGWMTAAEVSAALASSRNIQLVLGYLQRRGLIVSAKRADGTVAFRAATELQAVG